MNTNKKGRPPRSKKPSTEIVAVRLTDAEKKYLIESSAKANLSFVDFVRSRLFDYDINNINNLVALFIHNNESIPIYYNTARSEYSIKTSEYSISTDDLITLEDILHGKFLSSNIVLLDNKYTKKRVVYDNKEI